MSGSTKLQYQSAKQQKIWSNLIYKKSSQRITILNSWKDIRLVIKLKLLLDKNPLQGAHLG